MDVWVEEGSWVQGWVRERIDGRRVEKGRECFKDRTLMPFTRYLRSDFL